MKQPTLKTKCLSGSYFFENLLFECYLLDLINRNLINVRSHLCISFKTVCIFTGIFLYFMCSEVDSSMFNTESSFFIQVFIISFI